MSCNITFHAEGVILIDPLSRMTFQIEITVTVFCCWTVLKAAAVSISPMGVGLSVSEYVAAAIAVLEAQDRVQWQLDSMFTTLEGEPDDLFEVIRAMQEAVFAAGGERVGTVIKMDDRRDRSVSMADKVASVEVKRAARRETD